MFNLVYQSIQPQRQIQIANTYHQPDNIMRLAIVFLLFTQHALGQVDCLSHFNRAKALYDSGQVQEAYTHLQTLKNNCPQKDKLYPTLYLTLLELVYGLEQVHRLNEDYEQALAYGREALELIETGGKYLDKKGRSNIYFIHKNLLVNYMGLKQLDKAKQHRDVLYAAHRKKLLPEGLDGYFNFDFFKHNNLNVWGYEWYHALPADRYSSSFTKIVYYVYSTKEDGSDDAQLYRFHVKMFHGDPQKTAFDYLLEKQIDTETANISGSYFQYTYQEKIDYLKLRADIVEAITKDIQPATRRITPNRR